MSGYPLVYGKTKNALGGNVNLPLNKYYGKFKQPLGKPFDLEEF